MVITRLFWPPCQIQKFKFLMIFRHQADLNCLFYISLVNRPINTVWKTFVNDQKCSVLKLKLLIIARQNLNKSSFFSNSCYQVRSYICTHQPVRSDENIQTDFQIFYLWLRTLFIAKGLTSGFYNKSSGWNYFTEIMTKKYMYIKLILFPEISGL